MKWLLCKPTFYGIKYEINPWMNKKVSADQSIAYNQWSELYKHLKNIEDIELVEQKEDVPDMVFVANAGLVYNSKALVSEFKFPQRQPESSYFEKWFSENNFEVVRLSGKYSHEGEGDALFAGKNKLEAKLFCGYGFRSQIEAHEEACELLSIDSKRVVMIELKDPRFYHLDTCFFPIDENKALCWHKAFSKSSLAKIENNIEIIGINEEDALSFACNSLALDKKIIMPVASTQTYSKLEELGYEVITVPMGEFLKAGGAAKCLSLRLD